MVTLIFNPMLLITLLFYTIAGSIDAYLLVMLVKAWLHQDDYYNKKREEDYYLWYFKNKVAGSWIFHDGKGW